jgi:hypothetical protein
MEELIVRQSIVDLLAGAGLEAGDFAVEPANGGGNNRVFVVHGREGKYLAKIYYSHPSDTRNRLTAEYAFLTYAQDIGLRCVPRPISCDPEKNLGLYEFVEGEKLRGPELGVDHVQQAARFFLELNTSPKRQLANALPMASEACFSVEQHFSVVDRRIDRLRGFSIQSDLDRQALSFINELTNVWQRVKAQIEQKTESAGTSGLLDCTNRCVSPSDFGFHNALVLDSGEVCFIDFEYAGWDDPAKAIGDFFCQPAVPVPFNYFESFLKEALSYTEKGEELGERTRMLLPVFQTKWCCIMLNEFLPDAARRRRFANPVADPELSKWVQLEKAQQFFSSTLQTSWPI